MVANLISCIKVYYYAVDKVKVWGFPNFSVKVPIFQDTFQNSQDIFQFFQDIFQFFQDISNIFSRANTILAQGPVTGPINMLE